MAKKKTKVQQRAEEARARFRASVKTLRDESIREYARTRDKSVPTSYGQLVGALNYVILTAGMLAEANTVLFQEENANVPKK